jgi:signal transduction histidine kinase
LALSRADRLTYDQQPFDLSAALQTLAQKMTPVLQQSLITQIPAGITVTAHAPSIEKIITNFLSNAGKYSPVTSTITLTLQRTDQGTQVAVTDQGPGISAEDQAHIFERFYRGSDTRGTIPGTGLGMAIAKQLADANQCTITIENQHPTGTKFILTFH